VNYSGFGPQATNALAASLSQYCSKFFTYLAASELALFFQSLEENN
jgi:hypothetical protein